MHKLKAFSLALVAAMLAPTASRADDAAVRKQIESQMALFQQAFRRKDMAALRAITTPDFTMKTKGGVVSTRREAEAAMAADMKSIVAITDWKLKIEKISVKGDSATLIVSENMTAKLSSPMTGNRQSVSFVRMRETWIKTRVGWRYKRAEALVSETGPKGMTFVAADQLDTRTPEYVVARKAIQAQYAAYQRAVRKKDYKAALATMDESVTVVYPNGRTFNRKQTELSLQQVMIATRNIPEWELKIIHVSLRGSTAFVSVGERMVSNYADFHGMHKQTLTDFYQDTWVKTAKGWRLKNTLVLRGSVTVDGKTGDPFK